ncbi:pilus assembly protein TadG-related protein [Streptomyces sp. CEV 2-1]|uniref:pilus assembly protein TadG-related protein n=1 Tax=Streptomyces sp. CEV 2-1 TaxID=2485153 RepID=UPI00288B57F2|nr:pilus assembly protein TadG-related protein [Streptomyces sp. CEV 2-1]
MSRNNADRGQAFPIYIVMVAGLLFVAFAFFAVGQASATRNGAQGAADAAALAAAQDARDGLGPPFLAALQSPNGLDEFLRDYRYGPVPCVQAQRLAAANDSDVVGGFPGHGGCSWDYGYLQDKVTAEVKTRYTVGSSVIPGTATKHATADATAVIEFRCTWKAKDAPSTDPGADDDGGDKGDKGDEGDKPDLPMLTFDCDGRDGIDIDPTDPQPWAELGKALFAVHLID